MKSKWILIEQDLSVKWSDAEIEKFKENCQMEIDRDILKRYESDWEFRNAVDNKLISQKIGARL